MAETFNGLPNPEQVNIGTSEAPLFVPKGSAGELNFNQNIKSPVIPVNQITPQTPLNLQNTPTPDTSSSVVAGAKQGVKSYEQYLAEITAPKTALDTQEETLMGEIGSLLPDTQGRGTAQATKESELGIPDTKKQLSALNAQILSKVAEYEKLFVGSENQPGVSLSVVLAQQGQIRRTQASDIGLLQARALGIQGQLQTAQETANRAIDLKYQDAFDKLNLKKSQLELIQPLLNKQEKNQALALGRKYEDEQAKLQEKKAKQKVNLALTMELGVKSQFINKGGEFAVTADGTPIETPEEFFKLAGVKSFAEAYQKGLVIDVTNDMVEERGFVNKIAVEYKDAGILPSDSIAIATKKLQRSAKYLKEANDGGFTLGEGQVRYDANGNAVAKGPPKADTNGLTPYQQFQATSSLRKELSTNTQSARTVSQQYQLMKETYDRLEKGEVKDLNGTSQAIIATFNKVLDPNSVVKEGEYARTERGQSLLARIEGKITTLQQGGAGLTKESLKELVDLASVLKGSYGSYIVDQNEIIRQNAEAFGLNPDLTGATNSTETMGSPPSGEIWVKDKASGQTGSIPIDEYEESKYEKISFNSVGNTSASAIASAIKKVESNGNYNAKGGSGENGAYQFMPATWRSWAGNYLSNANAPMTPENQDKVAIARINDLLKKGHNAREIALIWNGGQPIVKKGTNKFGVKYDSGAYAQKVLKALG